MSRGPLFRPLRLRTSIFLSFTLSALLLIGVYTALAFYAIDLVFDRMRGAVLHDVLITALEAVDTPDNAKFKILAETAIYSDDARFEPIPEALQAFPEGISNLNDPTDRHKRYVWRERYNNHDYLIIREKLVSRSTIAEMTALLAVVSVASFLLMIAVARFLSGRIVRPLRNLADELTAASRAPSYQPLKSAVSNDEVGRLAGVCDVSLKRLHKALARERRFTGDVSHELNSPLAVTETSLELLSMTPLTPAQRRHVERSLASVEQMGELLTIFLAFARDAVRNDFEATDSVARMMVRMQEMWGPKAREKGLELIFVRRAECPGYFSPVLLGAVFSNLLKNAIDYSTSGRILVTETADGFEVEDEAGGIAPETKARLFKRYGEGAGRVSLNRGDGHGIGLNLVKRIADRCGWHVRCEDVVQGQNVAGTRFVITLRENASTLDMREKSL